MVPTLLACELGHAPADAGAVDYGATDAPQPDAGKTPIKGCAWFAGTWTLTDCTDESFVLEAMTGADCVTHLSAPSPTFAGAWGQVKDAAMTLILPALGSQCQGSFDGASIRGACGLPAGPCGFVAIPAAP